ncbi:MAG: nickel pincer cofactor biosynthesis protein LarC [Actinomycetota bacterium]|nr:nickel pincer cofactor biosynthesis protein LarC [Actinomycetota bacterium]
MTATGHREGRGTTGRHSGEQRGGGARATGEDGGETVAWFHCFAGIAGDMALASLLDAGADLDAVRSLLRALPFDGWDLAVEHVLRGGLAATRVVVSVTDEARSRSYREVVALVEQAVLPERVRDRSIAALRAVATVEARLHGIPVDDVHLHELGGHDTVVDVVGTMAALEVLGVDRVESSPVAVGLGTVRAAHGVLPNPAPAVVALLTGAPTWGRDLGVELTTPTGAAIVATLAEQFGPLPPVSIAASGFGAGTRELEELPNVVQVVVGTATGSAVPGPRGGAGGGVGAGGDAGAGEVAGLGSGSGSGSGQPVYLLETNLDDATGEQLAHAVVTLLEAGALDAWLTPVVMKKGRPGAVVHVLADVADVARLRGVLRTETGSFGVRGMMLERWPVTRRFETVEVDGHPVRVKVGAGRAKAEHADTVAVGRATGRPAREVAARAEARWHATRDGEANA